MMASARLRTASLLGRGDCAKSVSAPSRTAEMREANPPSFLASIPILLQADLIRVINAESMLCLRFCWGNQAELAESISVQQTPVYGVAFAISATSAEV